MPAIGTMAHSWIQFFDTEYEAFKAYAEVYPDNCTLLIDTYDILQSGAVNAIKVAKEVLEPMGKRLKGVRIDSGDLAYFSKKLRKMFDANGMEDCKIVVSNSVDEFLIKSLQKQDAKIDSYGVGERMITSKSDPVFGGVYKLVAVERDGELIPKIKLSENVSKITTPDFKELWRFYDKNTGKAMADLITCYGEEIDDSKPYTLFDPEHPYKKKKVTDFTARKLLVKIFENGKCVYTSPSATEIRSYCADQLETLWDEVKRFENPHEYYVDLSKKLWDKKNELLNMMSAE